MTEGRAEPVEPSGWGDGTDLREIPEVVRRAYSALAGPVEVRTLSGGLLHRTFHLRTTSGEYVLQRVSDVFAPEIHTNIAAVARHLAARGFETLELLPTADGALFVDADVDAEGLGRWRLMTHLPGVACPAIESNAQAHSAGRLVGRFHAALDDFTAPLAPMGIPYRNTPRYRAGLAAARGRHEGHRLAPRVAELAVRIEAGFAQLGPVPDVPDRVIHGDLKLANVLFEGREPPARDRARALIDFDTLMRAPLYCEWGDAWRSWCNPAGEDGGAARFDLEIFEASARGFFEGFGGRISRAEVDSLVDATERIALELCVRFATDMLEESYFAWDPGRHRSAGDHHALRAERQLELFEVARGCRAERAGLLAELAATFRAVEPPPRR